MRSIAGASPVAERLLGVAGALLGRLGSARRQEAARLPLQGGLLHLLMLAQGGPPAGLSPASVAALLEGATRLCMSGIYDTGGSCCCSMHAVFWQRRQWFKHAMGTTCTCGDLRCPAVARSQQGSVLSPASPPFSIGGSAGTRMLRARMHSSGSAVDGRALPLCSVPLGLHQV